MGAVGFLAFLIRIVYSAGTSDGSSSSQRNARTFEAVPVFGANFNSASSRGQPQKATTNGCSAAEGHDTRELVIAEEQHVEEAEDAEAAAAEIELEEQRKIEAARAARQRVHTVAHSKAAAATEDFEEKQKIEAAHASRGRTHTVAHSKAAAAAAEFEEAQQGAAHSATA